MNGSIELREKEESRKSDCGWTKENQSEGN